MRSALRLSGTQEYKVNVGTEESGVSEWRKTFIARKESLMRASIEESLASTKYSGIMHRVSLIDIFIE